MHIVLPMRPDQIVGRATAKAPPLDGPSPTGWRPIPLQLPLAPMRLVAIGVELPNDAAMERS
jgi:hypothetical protein